MNQRKFENACWVEDTNLTCRFTQLYFRQSSGLITPRIHLLGSIRTRKSRSCKKTQTNKSYLCSDSHILKDLGVFAPTHSLGGGGLERTHFLGTMLVGVPSGHLESGTPLTHLPSRCIKNPGTDFKIQSLGFIAQSQLSCARYLPPPPKKKKNDF